MLLVLLMPGCGQNQPVTLEAIGRISYEEVARVDGYEHDLVSINRSALSEDGVIAIAQPRVGTVLFVDDEGSLLGSVGSPGQGPGEFLGVGDMGWWGTDTLWVYDPRQRRMTSFFTETLQELEAASIGSLVPTREEGWVGGVRVLAITRNRGLLVRGIPGGPSSTVEAIGVSEPGAPTERILGTLPRIDDQVLLGDDGTRVGIGIPWTLRSPVDVSPDGRRVASLVMREGEGGTIHVTTTVLGLDGDTVFSTPATFDGVPITASEADSALEAAVGRVSQRMRDALDMDVEAAYLNAVSLPPIRPAFSTIVVGIDGSVWQRVRSLASYEAGAYVWLDPSGAIRGVGELPGAGYIIEADDEIVWVMETDPVGVPSLVVYRYSLDSA